jgi:hypothetical protein
MTHLGTPSGTSPETYFFYDSSDRNSGMEQYDETGNGSCKIKPRRDSIVASTLVS